MAEAGDKLKFESQINSSRRKAANLNILYEHIFIG